MELKIDIDMNKIDYDAINQQIQEKVKDLNIADSYSINNKIKECVDEYVRRDAKDYIERTYYYSNNTSQLSSTVQNNIKDLAKEKLKNL